MIAVPVYYNFENRPHHDVTLYCGNSTTGTTQPITLFIFASSIFNFREAERS